MKDKIHGNTNVNAIKKLELIDEQLEFNQYALCKQGDDPDLWFSEENEIEGRRGGPTAEEVQATIDRTIQAIQICNTCKVKDLCLQEGMREENLTYGVWGGMMSGERMLLARKPISNSFTRNKIIFTRKIRNKMKGNA